MALTRAPFPRAPYGFLLASLMLFLVTGPARSADVYWAFGDSNTWAVYFDRIHLNAPLCFGSGQAFVPPPPFPTGCGFPHRLQLDFGKTVHNRGFPSESTSVAQFGSPGAVNRIDDPGEPLEFDRCTDPENGHTLLLKHGTNDAFIPLTVDVQFNFEQMIDHGTSKCVNAAIASVIRRIVQGRPAYEPPIGDPWHSSTTQIADAARAVAQSRNRRYVPIWDSLCADPTSNETCYWVYYQQRTGEFDPGHLNNLGHDRAFVLFRDAIEWRPPAGVASGLAPVGDVADTSSTFSWSEWDTANGFNTGNDWYFLQINGPASHGRWYPEEAICSGGGCALAPLGSALPGGNYQWRIRTRNLQGLGQWTSYQNVTVYDAPPAAPLLSAPLDQGFDTTPTYEWTESGSSTTFDVEVNGSVPAALDDLPKAICSSACRADQPTPLGPGMHNWRVQAANPKGATWSAGGSFEVLDCAFYPDKNLPATTVSSGSVLERACSTVKAGELGPYVVSGSAVVEFHAGGVIELYNGFSVESGTFVANNA